MSEEILENIKTPIEEEIVELPQRANLFCVISKATFGEYAVHDIQTNSSWGENPYGEGYAVVPDDMVTAIMETLGFCDIELNEDETEVVSFTANEIPRIPQGEAPLTDIDILYEIEADQEFRLSCLEMGLSADDFAQTNTESEVTDYGKHLQNVQNSYRER